MAIVINGSGSITGISAGGLPDGSVTASDIESSLDLSGKTVTLPSGTGGKVLQIVEARYDNQLTSITTLQTFVGTGHTGSITTTQDNSKIFVMIHAQGYQNNGSGCNVGLQRKINTGSYTRLLGTDGGNGNTWMGDANGTANTSWTINRQHLDDPQQVAGTLLTYNPMVSAWSSGTIYYGYANYNAECTMFLIEVAA